MSYRHIRLKKTIDKKNKVEYQILCPDFNNQLDYEGMGTLVIDKKSKTFSHENDKLWVKNKIYPIDLFRLEPIARMQEVSKKYSEYGSGAWAMSVYEFLNNCFETNEFPETQDLIG
jgi:hypothetical protein